MSDKLDPKERAGIIRKANELYNRGEMEKAAKLFWHTDYRDGLLRVGEYLLEKEHKPFQALPYFQKAQARERVSEILGRMLWALSTLMKEKD